MNTSVGNFVLIECESSEGVKGWNEAKALLDNYITENFGPNPLFYISKYYWRDHVTGNRFALATMSYNDNMHEHEEGKKDD